MSNMMLSITPPGWKPMLTRGAKVSKWPRQPISATATPLHRAITHSMSPEKFEVIKSLEPWVSQHVLPLIKPIEKCWQPSNFLPNSSEPAATFMDEVRMLQDRSAHLPDEYLVVLVGNMIIEDAIPTYSTLINTLDGVQDETGASSSPWAIWSRAWTAEENRHGDLLRTYLYLSGRVDMVMVERTVQYLLAAGMDGGVENNPYLGFVYTSFQERATFVNHGNIARVAKEHGDPLLATICGTIAADEKRHEKAYVKIIERLLEVDPNETMLSIGKMMRKGAAMPGALMYDGCDTQLFEHMSLVNQRLGLYTTDDYVDILKFLIGRWGLEKLEGLKGDGKREQEFVCRLPKIITKLHKSAGEQAKKGKAQQLKFSWIFNKEITV